MGSPCQNCGSRSVRHDRSLGGRAVCGACGLPLGQRFRRGRSTRGVRRRARRGSFWRAVFALVLIGVPLALTLAHEKGWLRLPRQLQPGDWPIRTSADVELLLREAQPATADGVVRAGHGDQTNLVRHLLARLIAHRVAIVVTDAVPDGAAAVWNPARAEINLRPTVLHRGMPVLAEVLAHESAHVAQSCQGGGLHRSAVPLGIPVDAAATFDASLKSGLYPGHASSKAVELEAYSVGARPAWAAELLDHYCS